MNIIVFDVETTGLKSNDEVIQLSGLHMDEKFNVLNVFNKYCKIDRSIPAEAINTHGITDEVLKHKSGGKYLEDHLRDMDYFVNAKETLFVGYNVSFDIGKLKYSLCETEYQDIDLGATVDRAPRDLRNGNYNICLMRTLQTNLGYAGRWKKLMDIYRESFGNDLDSTHKLKRALVEHFKVDKGHGNEGAHDALFDAIVTTQLLNKYKGFYL